ncbi:MAG: tryptophan synthase subunit alpha [Dehalococcoidales bacterium]|nr:tryptophan synthase subunit alpha [Dehalococcoidales bacterium]
MNNLALNTLQHKALVAYVTVGYPSVEATFKVVPLLAENGCDLIEMGIPFSDPLADGPVIQNASYHALQKGITPQKCLDIAAQLSSRVKIPLTFMTYINPVLSYGLDKFCLACAASGIKGLIIPDLPPEEGLELEEITRRNGIDLVYLLSPASTEQRIKLVSERSRGFVYLVSVTGVTGARKELPPELNQFVAKVKQAARIPVLVGFGISSAALAKQATEIADGVIVGSRIIQLMESDNSLDSVGKFIRELRTALDSR